MTNGAEQKMDPTQTIVRTLRGRYPHSWHVAALELLHGTGGAVAGADLGGREAQELLLAGYWFADAGHLAETRTIVDELSARGLYDDDLFFLRLMSGEPSVAPVRSLPVLLGVSMADFAAEDPRRRQAASEAANLDLIRGVCGMRAVNVCFPGEERVAARMTSVGSLRQSSRLACGVEQPVKPIVKEVFAELARLAVDAGSEYFLFANSDVTLTPWLLALVERYIADGYDSCAFTRTDVESGRPMTRPYWRMMHIGGSDAFLVRASWWLEHEHRFEPYIIGEMDWDTTYAAIMASRSRFYYFSHTRGVLLHEAHPQRWNGTSPLARYNLRLRDGCDPIFFVLHRMYYDAIMAHLASERSLPTFERNGWLMHIFKGGEKLGAPAVRR